MNRSIYTTRFASPRNRSFAFYFLVLALVLRSLIPAGFMPSYNSDSNGFVTLEICTPEGAFTMTVPIDGEGEGSSDAHIMADHQPCAFGSFSQQFFNVAYAIVEALLTPETSVVTLRAPSVDLPIYSIYGSPIGSRAPPASYLL